jgi:toxin CptA
MHNHEFKFSPSLIYCIFLAATIFASVIIAFVLPFAQWQCALLAAVLITYGVSIFWRFALMKAETSVTAIRKNDGGSWLLTTRGGTMEAALRGDSTVTNFISILRFDVPGKKRPIASIIFRDSMSADDYRRLVGALRMS